ncbi:Zinc finger CCCH domain-containing protein 3 [Wallemia ichthyophaga EXF-994]|uniref:Zinc finger CCCH domain-containing protein 3 n=1 Tax=Wallemia ichthyophaga (strain EXF-994 / CBS 113033) TaxID=1299270 RepID=R9ARX8_WALI9|nr:Zinc finger CCCH domain-containing protein 3 [Wallemia ichthyophaga EXF-994]EOR04780.1 Zinc finger CCCH domain-containing protein 3 [Wallemia ichthyophaga EXF-994]TIB29321.1 hypothetical protein E3P84_03748 [Wallemia ichthyophaga]TIB38934.1 hypothetical protein E3P83_03753 [Wallemia ichthyophaga]
MSSNIRINLQSRIAELDSVLSQAATKQGQQQPQQQQQHKPSLSYSHTSSSHRFNHKPRPPRHMNMSLTNTNTNPADPSQPPSWISRKSANMSLVSSNSLEKSKSLYATKQSQKAAKKAGKRSKLAKTSKQHQSITKDGRRHIIIDNVPFQFDDSGAKLVKVNKDDLLSFDDDPSHNPRENLVETASNTPKKMTIDGTNYVRTKSGNLVRDVFAKRRSDDLIKAKQQRLDKMTSMLGTVQKSRNLATLNRKPPHKKESLSEEQKLSFGRKRCPTFTKSGRCSKVLHCPYLHDSAKTSVCPHFLRKRCRNSDSTCPLSHSPSPHNMPHCSHFESPNGCRAGDKCIFSHVHLSKDAPVCRDFAVLGYCDKGADCDNRHVRECPDYSENGDCKNPSCKLPHILKSEANKAGDIEESYSAKRKEVNAGADDDTEQRTSDHDAPRKKFKRRKSSTDHLTQQSDFVTFDDSEVGSSVSSGDSDDSDQESVNSDDFDLNNESIPLY